MRDQQCSKLTLSLHFQMKVIIRNKTSIESWIEEKVRISDYSLQWLCDLLFVSFDYGAYMILTVSVFRISF